MGIGMNATELLAKAIAEVVENKFRSGIAYLRLPQLVNAMPVQAILD